MTVQRKLVAILAADIAEYSRLTILDEAGTVDRLHQLFTVAEQIVSRRAGRIVSKLAALIPGAKGVVLPNRNQPGIQASGSGISGVGLRRQASPALCRNH